MLTAPAIYLASSDSQGWVPGHSGWGVLSITIHCPCLLSPRCASAGTIHCRCGCVSAHCRVVLIPVLAWFVVFACIGCQCHIPGVSSFVVPHPCRLSFPTPCCPFPVSHCPAIHPASRGSQRWHRVGCGSWAWGVLSRGRRYKMFRT
jgi:hypothetical protein